MKNSNQYDTRMTMLVDKVKKKEVQNWMKGVLAINKTTEVLLPAVKGRFEQFISGLPDVEKEHLEIFYKCLRKNDVEHFKYCSRQKNVKRIWECTHHLCQNLMKRLLDNFENGSLKRLWKFKITRPVGHEYELNKSTQTHAQEEDGKWNLMKLFMYGEMDKVPRSSLNDLDFSQTVKLMRSCTLFTITDDSISAFEEALESRNQLMHSADNEVNNKDTSRIFEELTKLVDLFGDKTSNQQKEVVEDLHKLRDTNLFEKEETTEYKDLASKVLQIKQKALKLDISVNQNLTEESKIQSQDLVRMLNETTAEKTVLDYEKNLDTGSKQTEELQKRFHATKQQQEKMREKEERQQSQLKELEATVAKEQEIINDINRRIHQTKQQHEKLKEEEEQKQAQLQELQTNTEAKQQHENQREKEGRQQSQLKELEATERISIDAPDKIEEFQTETASHKEKMKNLERGRDVLQLENDNCCKDVEELKLQNEALKKAKQTKEDDCSPFKSMSATKPMHSQVPMFYGQQEEKTSHNFVNPTLDIFPDFGKERMTEPMSSLFPILDDKEEEKTWPKYEDPMLDLGLPVTGNKIARCVDKMFDSGFPGIGKDRVTEPMFSLFPILDDQEEEKTWQKYEDPMLDLGLPDIGKERVTEPMSSLFRILDDQEEEKTWQKYVDPMLDLGLPDIGKEILESIRDITNKDYKI